MNTWKPRELVIHDAVRDDPVTQRVLSRCPDVPVRTVASAKPTDVIKASEVLSKADEGILGKYLAGKGVLFIGPPGTAVDVFTMPDERMVCPHFDKLTLASNGCPYRCDWCYLKLTYRAAYPFMKVSTGLDAVKKQLTRRLARTTEPVMFNSGEMADSLALEHLTGHMQEMIPWFAGTKNGHLFLLTKSDNVDDILELDHRGRTVVSWSMNAPSVSRRFELGAPSFERLRAAVKVQAAGYPVRVRLDPIVPVEGWREEYAQTIGRIFEALEPERVTIGTLRFEPGFFRARRKLLTTGEALEPYLARMAPMFEPKEFKGKKKVGKYSFAEKERAELFSFAIDEVRRHAPDVTIALCKESATVWDAVGLELSKCACVCQLDAVDMCR